MHDCQEISLNDMLGVREVSFSGRCFSADTVFAGDCYELHVCRWLLFIWNP